MIPQYILTVVYFHAKRNCSLFKRIQSILLFLSLCIFFICFILLGFNIVAESLTYFGVGNLAAILFPLFFSIHKEISSEKNKDYIVNYLLECGVRYRNSLFHDTPVRFIAVCFTVQGRIDDWFLHGIYLVFLFILVGK